MCLFSAALYVNLTLRRTQDRHSKVRWLAAHSYASRPSTIFLGHVRHQYSAVCDSDNACRYVVRGSEQRRTDPYTVSLQP